MISVDERHIMDCDGCGDGFAYTLEGDTGGIDPDDEDRFPEDWTCPLCGSTFQYCQECREQMVACTDCEEEETEDDE